MARIPQSEIERIKREVSVERLVEASGVELKRVGKDLFGRCPFHAPDHTPSFSVTPATNLWNCLGACKEGGDVFKWVMKTKGVSFRHAYEILRTDPALAACSTAPVKHATVPTLAPPLALDADDQRLLNQSADYYRERFKQTPAALDYVVKRGLTHRDLVDRFRLGFADRTLGLRLPGRTRRSGEEIRSRLQRIGLLRASGHEHFNGCLVIPILDEQGNVSGLYGRKIRDDLRPGTAYHLYLPGPHRGVWNIEALATSKEIILCEALIDGLSFWSAGYRNVTASYGVAGFTDDHLAAFKRYGTERVLIAYDRDEAGDRAAEALAARLTAQGIECWRILFPKGMDANEYARKVTPADKSFGLAIRKALWLGKGPAPAAPSAAITAEPQTRIVVPEERIIAGPVRAASSLGAEPEAAKTWRHK